MPISQKTILAIYGELLGVMEAADAAFEAASQPTLVPGLGGEALDPVKALEGIRRRSNRAVQEAIRLMLRDEPKLEVDPISGKVR